MPDDICPMDSVPTIEGVMATHSDGGGICHWDVEGGRIELSCDMLQEALEAAYDPSMPNWPALVEAEIDLCVEEDG